MEYSTLILLCLLVFLLFLWYSRLKEKLSYWKRLGVPYIEPQLPWGNILQVADPNKHFADIMKNFYDKNKHHGDYVGMYFFTKPAILVTSPEFAKQVLCQDFQYFMNRGLYYNEKTDPLSAHIFALEGQKWKRIREKITPTFTSGKMKSMFHIISGVADRFNEYIAPFAQSASTVEMHDLLARYTTDVIAAAAFGVECNSLQDPNEPFRKITIKMMSFSKIKALKMFGTFVFPKIAKKLGLTILHKDVSSYFMALLQKTVAARKETGYEHKDFLQLLIQLHASGKLDGDEKKENDWDNLTFLEIAAQSFLFLFAGFETSSTTMAIALHHLALDQDVQDKAREEINSLYETYDGKLTYDSCMEMEYIEKVIHEVQRMYPTVGTVHRHTTKDYQLPNGPVIPKDVYVIIPSLGIHRDPDIYPNPMQFDPERFSPEQISSRPNGSYLGFGDGPRTCIGMRFGIMQSKIGLALLLRNYKFEVCETTKIPLNIDNLQLVFTVRGGVNLKVSRTNAEEYVKAEK